MWHQYGWFICFKFCWYVKCVDETDEEVLPIKKEPKSCICISDGKQDSIIWKWSKFEHPSRGNAIASAAEIKLQTSIKSLCFGQSGEAQVLQDHWLFTYSSPPEDECCNSTKELYLQLMIVELSELLKFWSFSQSWLSTNWIDSYLGSLCGLYLYPTTYQLSLEWNMDRLLHVTTKFSNSQPLLENGPTRMWQLFISHVNLPCYYNLCNNLYDVDWFVYLFGSWIVLIFIISKFLVCYTSY